MDCESEARVVAWEAVEMVVVVWETAARDVLGWAAAEVPGSQL